MKRNFRQSQHWSSAALSSLSAAAERGGGQGRNPGAAGQRGVRAAGAAPPRPSRRSISRGTPTSPRKTAARRPPCGTVVPRLRSRRAAEHARAAHLSGRPDRKRDSARSATEFAREAIVGTGHIAASIALPGQAPLPASSPLTVFNGVPQNGTAPPNPPRRHDSLALRDLRHRRADRTAELATTATAPRSTSPPSWAASAPSPRSKAKVGRRYSFGGRKRSYTLGPLLRRNPEDPRPLHLRRRHRHRRLRDEALQRPTVTAASYTWPPGPLAQLVRAGAS